MIFNSPRLQALRQKYAGQPDFQIPTILLMDRKEEYVQERAYLEEIIQSVRPEVQKDWLSKLTDENYSNHLSAWFEMRLSMWLQDAGEVFVEPEISGAHPDFIVKSGSQDIVVEAKVSLISEDERERMKWRSAICCMLEQIELSFGLDIKIVNLVQMPVLDRLQKEVILWLETNPDDTFEFIEQNGNRINMTSHRIDSLNHLGLIMSSGGFLINPDKLKSPIKQKAKQHKIVHSSEYPYIIALLMESPFLSAEEVAAAWFGKTEVIYDLKLNKIIEQRCDRSGLHFHKNTIQHQSVSGTLVFQARRLDKFSKTKLDAWFIQNPYAKVSIDPFLFPVKGRFIKTDGSKKRFTMSWITNEKRSGISK